MSLTIAAELAQIPAHQKSCFKGKYLSKINYTSKPLLRQTSGVRKQ
jgi:hypothetical protein